MRRAITTLFVFLCVVTLVAGSGCSTRFAAAPAERVHPYLGFNIGQERHRAKLVELEPESLLRICPPKHRFHGCTRFLEPRLSARCAATNGVWSLQVRASYNAVIFFATDGVIPHEMLHVRDIAAAVNDHLRTLERESFEHEADCSAAVEAAEREFESRLLAFARQSQALRN